MSVKVSAKEIDLGIEEDGAIVFCRHQILFVYENVVESKGVST